MESQAASHAPYEQTVQLVATFPAAAGKLVDAAGQEPVPGSRFQREILEFPDDEALQTVQSLGAQALEHSADHMYALSETCMSPVTPFAAFTLGRAVLESASLAAWLFDLEIDATERAARGMSVRSQALEDQGKFVESVRRAGFDIGNAKQELAGRVADMLTKAENRGVDPKQNRKGRILGFGSPMPRALELAGTLSGGETDYRLFSAVAHARSWALLGIGFKVSEGANAAVKDVEPSTLHYVCFRSIEYFARALWDQAYLYGWKSGPFARLLEETYDSLGLIPERRFWRDQTVAHL